MASGGFGAFPDDLLCIVADFADNPALPRGSRRLWEALRWRSVHCVAHSPSLHRLAVVGECVNTLRVGCPAHTAPAELCAAVDRCCHLRVLRVHLRPGQTHPRLLDHLEVALLRGVGSAVGGLTHLSVRAACASLCSIRPLAAVLLRPTAHPGTIHPSRDLFI